MQITGSCSVAAFDLLAGTHPHFLEQLHTYRTDAILKEDLGDFTNSYIYVGRHQHEMTRSSGIKPIPQHSRPDLAPSKNIVTIVTTTSHGFFFFSLLLCFFLFPLFLILGNPHPIFFSIFSRTASDLPSSPNFLSAFSFLI